MTDAHLLITEHIDIWTSAIKKRSATGRGSSKKIELTGIKKLRELILELAVRGKLVSQDPNDESASVLLEKIAAKKELLIKDKKIKKTKALPDIGDSEKQINLPEGWEWIRLSEFSEVKGGKRLPKGHALVDYKTPHAYLRVTDMKNGSINMHNLLYLSSQTQELINQYTISKDDLYITIAGTIGDIGTIPDELDGMNLTENAAKIVFSSVNRLWLEKSLSANFSQSQFLEKTNQLAQPKLALHRILSSVVALPPLAEQHRIVVKVDELMALCDQLEQQTEDSITAHQTLVETLLATLTSSENTEDFNQSWARIAEHFDTLFTTEHSIDQLKQTILQLAVMGKLVPQNPNDEPASVLLEKITAEKEQLIKDKKIKKQKPLPAITEDEKSFELPTGWEWSRLEYVALNSEAGWSPRCLPTPRENGRWGVLKVSAVTWGQFNPNENKELPNSLEPRVQYEIKAGDFLISRANTAQLVARAVIVPNDTPQKLMMSDKIIRFVLSSNIEGAFISLVNNSSISKDYYAEVAGGTSSSMKNVSREQIRSLVVALPPLREQQHIVTKVDELMILCEQLKAHLNGAQTTQLHLAYATVEQAIV